MLHYNFVFLYATSDYIYPMLGTELYNHPQVRVYKYAFNGPNYIQKLFHMHTSYSINKKIELPFKQIWFKRMYKQDFKNSLPTCYVFLGGNTIRFDGGFLTYIRTKNPKNRIVVLHWDLISKKIRYDYDIIKRKVDLAVTYDKKEAKQYRIHYFQETPYSRILELPAHIDIKYDVYFLGAAKDRLEKLYEVFFYLKSYGVKCKFLIAGVPSNKQLLEEGLEYIDSISYRENIRNVICSKCVLEIVQEGSNDITLRAKEAIAYQKRLITNCKTDLSPFFNAGQLIQFDTVSQINIRVIEQDLPREGYPILLDMDPLRRLYDIQEQLEKIDEGSAN